MVVKSGRGVKSVASVMAQARRCDPLKMRIKCFCKKEKTTQAQYADLIHISSNSLSKFMTGQSAMQSEVYTKSMVYLKKRMPISECDLDSVSIKSTFSNYTLA